MTPRHPSNTGDSARQRILRTIRQSDIIAGLVQARCFQPRDSYIYDPALLEARVPTDVLRECVIQKEKRSTFWVRETSWD